MTTLTVVNAGDRIGLYRENTLEHEGETVHPAALLAWAQRDQPYEVNAVYAALPEDGLPYDLADLEIESSEDPDWELAVS